MKRSIVITAAAMLAAIALPGAEILHQDFEDTKIFKAEGKQDKQVGLSKNIGGNWLGFNGSDFRIVRENAPGEGEQALQISRVNPAVRLSAFRTVELPQDRAYTVRLMIKPGSTDKCFFGFLLRNSFADQEAARIQFGNQNMILSVVNGRGQLVMRSTPNEWQELRFTVTPGIDTLKAEKVTADGKAGPGNSTPLVKGVPVNQIVFFNIPGSTESALIDNVEISFAD